MKRTCLLTTFCLILTCHRAPAPLFGAFANLNKLINEAEFVVVAEIVDRPETLDFGSGGVFCIAIIKTLKGDAREGTHANAYLRDLQFGIGPRTFVPLTNEFTPGQLYLLFLNKGGTGFHDENNKPITEEFETTNCSASAIWVNPLRWYLDLDSLKGKSVRESVVAVLNHTAKRAEELSEAVNQIIDSRAENNRLTERVIQTVWLDNNAEEAAEFYRSIFPDSWKDRNIGRYREPGPNPGEMFTGVRLWIEGQTIVFLNGNSKSKPIEPARLILNCDTQEEIDYYWQRLSDGGQPGCAGWIRDKYGVWWHVIPTDLLLLLGGKYGRDPDELIAALLKMEKIDSAALPDAKE